MAFEDGSSVMHDVTSFRLPPKLLVGVQAKSGRGLELGSVKARAEHVEGLDVPRGRGKGG